MKREYWAGVKSLNLDRGEEGGSWVGVKRECWVEVKRGKLGRAVRVKLCKCSGIRWIMAIHSDSCFSIVPEFTDGRTDGKRHLFVDASKKGKNMAEFWKRQQDKLPSL